MKLILVKIGGSTLGSHDTTLEDLVTLQKNGRLPVVVHGGGKLITEWLEKQKVPTRFERGLRVTDAQSLEVVVAVLAGLVNKQLVASLNSLGGKAAGLSGVDGGFIEARIRNPELGYVGEVVNIKLDLLRSMLSAGYIPVIAPIGFFPAQDATAVAMLNLNADTVAGELANALEAEALVFLTDVVGVCDRSGKLLPRLLPEDAATLVATGVVSEGMIPKVEACLKVLSVVPSVQIIDGRVPHALLDAIEGKIQGTTIGVKSLE